ncbi:3-deoxy-D-manno-octulosonic-acid transferase [Desulfurobacterium pacificum]|uniref:3-deoxy-D-manno-octulosonic acid transferase n=1 Tax=Desulfurobacterium pacificum TaxID=240166 RepID=A0ABY1NUK6_9BACT|nr:glycosyltransferase N-terminal domain-containing protein [Desulfurobacterium pacificum]SMP18740.1 3-deoxy-D-manno-octulosonic-acid transferase [Desulfurobacterium pacificum]
MFWLYNLLILLSIPVFPLIKLKSKKRGNVSLKNRLSSFVPPKARGRILLHAASIGEINTCKPLIETLKDRIAITTFTDYGLSRARKLFPEVPSRVIPLDFYPLTKSFLKRGRFRKILIFETEIWLSLLRSAKELNIPVYFISGKISEKTFKRLQKFKPFIFPLLSNAVFLAKSETDAIKARQLGFKETRVVGNLKFAFTQPEKVPLTVKGNRKIILWGSTHEGEEELAVKTHYYLKSKGLNPLTIIAPRHINRKIPTPPSQTTFRSQTKVVEENVEFYVINTIGELSSLYAYCDVAVIGGSFVKGIGGHNPVEAAAWKKPVIVGKHVESFEDVVETLQIPKIEASQISETLKKLLSNEAERENLAEKIHKNYLKQKNVLEKILKAIGESD